MKRGHAIHKGGLSPHGGQTPLQRPAAARAAQSWVTIMEGLTCIICWNVSSDSLSIWAVWSCLIDFYANVLVRLSQHGHLRGHNILVRKNTIDLLK